MRSPRLACCLAIAAACTPASNDAPVPEVVVEPTPSAAAPTATPRTSAPEPTSVLATQAAPRFPDDLAWLTELVRAMAEHPVTREQVIGYLGADRGTSPYDAFRRLVAPRSQHLSRAEVYQRPHAHIEIAISTWIPAAQECRLEGRKSIHAPSALNANHTRSGGPSANGAR